MARPRDLALQIDLFSAPVSPLAPSVSNAPIARRTFAPTAEQLAVVAASDAGESLAANAFAGAAKTTTLELVAERQHSRRQRGIYLAFNRAIAAEAAGRFGTRAQCKTTHSLAYGAIAGLYGGDSSKLTGAMSVNAVIQWLSLQRDDIDGMSPRHAAEAIRRTVAAYCYSADAQISIDHVFWPTASRQWSPAYSANYAQAVVSYATRLWTAAQQPDSPVPLGHDGYLKRWAMQQPRFRWDYVMLDEAQDSNPVLLQALSGASVPVFYVGDQYQQIYSFRNAVNAMAAIPKERSYYLTQSFRFGEDIAALATRVLNLLDEERAVVGAGGPGVVVTDNGHCAPSLPFAAIGRTNAGLIGAIFEADRKGLAVHVVGGTTEIMALIESAELLQAGISPADGPLFGFESWQAFIQHVKEFGGELRPFVQIVELHGLTAIRSVLARVVEVEADAGVVVSTAHKSKGREWQRVVLLDDYRLMRRTLGDETARGLDEELRIFYVALTRAKSELFVPTVLLRDLSEAEML